MANLETVARPYAKAILSLATDERAYAEWSQMLGYLSAVVSDARVNKLLRNMAIAAEDKADFLITVAPEMLSAEAKNLVKLLAYYKRLLIIPQLYQMYEAMRRDAEKQISMQLILARELEQDELSKLQAIFAKQLGKNLTLVHKVDPTLIGGGKVQIGDRVLDASIKGGLSALYKHLTQ